MVGEKCALCGEVVGDQEFTVTSLEILAYTAKGKTEIAYNFCSADDLAGFLDSKRFAYDLTTESIVVVLDE